MTSHKLFFPKDFFYCVWVFTNILSYVILSYKLSQFLVLSAILILQCNDLTLVLISNPPPLPPFHFMKVNHLHKNFYVLQPNSIPNYMPSKHVVILASPSIELIGESIHSFKLIRFQQKCSSYQKHVTNPGEKTKSS